MYAKFLSNGREDKIVSKERVQFTSKDHEAVSKEQRIKKLNGAQLSEKYTKLNKANTKQQKELDLIRKEISDRTQNQLKEFAKQNP